MDNFPSIEKLAAFFDGNLPENEVQQITRLAADNEAIHEILGATTVLDDTMASFDEKDLQLPDEIVGMDFELPEIENMDSFSVNGYRFWTDENPYSQKGYQVEVKNIESASSNNTQNAENMTEKKNYGYEPNNELNKFDPNIWQGFDNTCAIRSQEIILRDYGIIIPKDVLVEYATEHGWFDPDPMNGGTPKEYIGNLMDECGIQTVRTENATIFDIVAELKAGHRVIVSLDAEELWVKNEPNIFKKLFGEAVNKVNDTIQNIKGIEGANHALVVAGVNVNPRDLSDVKVVLIDSGDGNVCIEYSLKDFQNAWSDGHFQMVSTTIPAPYQYNYHTHEMEPSGFNTEFIPSMIEMPDGLENHFVLTDSYYSEYRDFQPIYDDEDHCIDVGSLGENHSNIEDAGSTKIVYENTEDHPYYGEDEPGWSSEDTPEQEGEITCIVEDEPDSSTENDDNPTYVDDYDSDEQ